MILLIALLVNSILADDLVRTYSPGTSIYYMTSTDRYLYYSTSDDPGAVLEYNFITGQLVHRYSDATNSSNTFLYIVASGSILLGGTTSSLLQWDVDSKQLVRMYDYSTFATPTAVNVVQDLMYISFNSNPNVKVVNWSDGTELSMINYMGMTGYSYLFYDPWMALTLSNAGYISIMDFTSSTHVPVFINLNIPGAIKSFKLSADKTTILVATSNSNRPATVAQYSINGSLIRQFEQIDRNYYTAFALWSNYVFVTDDKGYVDLFSTADGSYYRNFSYSAGDPMGAPSCVATSQNYLFASGQYGMSHYGVKQWYANPLVIHSVIPSSADPQSGQVLVISIENTIGTNGVPNITIADRPCGNVSWVDSSTLNCILPVGTGSNALLVIDFTPLGTPLTMSHSFTYNGPVLESLSVDHGPCAGGVSVSATVTNLGLSDPVYVQIGSSLQLATQTDSNHITFQLIPNYAPGNVTVFVIVGDQISNTLEFMYDDPVVTMITPVNGFAVSGGETLNFIGYNFGVCDRSCSRVAVSIGSATCTNARVQNDSLVTCTTPAGVGCNLTIIILINSTTITFPQSFSYVRPTISSISPSTGIAVLNNPVTITGQSFGTNSNPVQVYFIPINSTTSASVACLTPTWQSATIIFCNFPQLQGNTNYRVLLVVGGQNSTDNVMYHNSDGKEPAVSFPVSSVTLENVPCMIVLNGSSPSLESISFYVSQLAMHGTLYQYSMSSLDSKGAVISQPSLVSDVSGRVIYQPSANYHGNDSFLFITQSLSGNSIQTIVSVQVEFVNQRPFVNSSYTTVTLKGDVLSNITLSVQDPDDTEWVYYITSIPTHGMLLVAGMHIESVPFVFDSSISVQHVSFMPVMYESGTPYDSFSWNCRDSVNNTLVNDVTVSIVIPFVNHPPTAYSVITSTVENEQVIISLTATDPDPGQALVFSIVTLPLHGTLYQVTDTLTSSFSFSQPGTITNNNLIIYKPFQFYSGNDSFMYSVSDGFNSSVSYSGVNVQFVNQPPMFDTSVMTITMTPDVAQYDMNITVTDIDEYKGFYIKIGAVVPRGIWTVNGIAMNFNVTSNFNTSIKWFILSLQPDSNGGGYPYAQLTLIAFDSHGAQSTNNLSVTALVQCPAGQYNSIWNNQGSFCQVCPDGGLCSKSGQEPMTNDQGYYPLTNTTFITCSPPNACPIGGMTTNGSFACDKAYTGMRCGACQNGYYRSGIPCEPCPSYQLPTALIVVLLIIALALLMFLMYKLRNMDLGFLSISVTYIQALAIFRTVKMQWPAEVTSLLNSLSVINFKLDIISPECFVVKGSDSAYEFKFYVTLLMPIGLCVFGACLIGCIVLFERVFGEKLKNNDKNINIEKLKNNDTIENKNSKLDQMNSGADVTLISSVINAILLFFKLMYFTLAETSIQLFDCSFDPAKGFFFEVDPHRRCFVESWWITLLPTALFGIIFYAIGIPVLTGWLLYKRTNVQKKEFLQRTPFENLLMRVTYQKNSPFRPDYQFWDSVIILRKLIIVCTKMFFSSYPDFQAVLLIAIFVISVQLQLVNQPYSSRHLNTLETVTLNASIFVLLGGVLSLVGSFSPPLMKALSYAIVIVAVSCSLIMIRFLVAIWKESYQTGERIAARKRSESKGAKGGNVVVIKTDVTVMK